MSTRYHATRDEYRAVLAGRNEPSYRADQVFDGLWTQRRPLDALTNVGKQLRDDLAAEFPEALTPVVEQQGDGGLTTKWLWAAAGGAQIETVLMRYKDRATVCISSQAGCAMGCTFCATGQAGFERHLDAGEICEQVLRAQHASPQRVGNVVYMGMGEPLANVEPVLQSLTRLHADAGFSARHLTVSTVGVVPGINRLREFPLPVTLAVSLHAPDDALREQLVPLDRRYPIAEVLDAAARLRGGQRPARHVRVRVHLRHQRPSAPGRRPGRPAPRIPRRGPRQPDPAEPHQRIRWPRGRVRPHRALRGTPARTRRPGLDPPQPRRRHRRCVWSTAVPHPCPRTGRAEPARGIGHNGPVNEHRFFNPSQPQTLQTGVLLCYLSAVFGLIFGVVASSAILALFIIIGLAAGGYGIANEKRWGYVLAVTAASLHVLMYLLIYRSHIVTDVGLLISFVFDVALVLLLVHPMSRDYQRIWFK